MAIRNDLGIDGQVPMAVDAAYEGILPPAPGVTPNDLATHRQVAQNTASTPPVVITIALEDGNISRLPADADISNVRANGADLEFVQPDGTIIVVPGGSIANLVLFVGDIQIPAEAVTLMFETAGIEPAAGPAGTEGAHGGYEELGPQTVGAQGRGNSLLANTELPGLTAADGIELSPNEQVIFPDDGLFVSLSEEGLDEGDFIGNPDDDPNSPDDADTTNEASVTFTLGAFDPEGVPPTYSFPDVPSIAYFSSGQLIAWTLSPGGLTLTGSVGTQTVVTIVITDQECTVTLSAPFDHPGLNAEDVLPIVLPIQATDGTSGLIQSTLTLLLEDDSPFLASPVSSSLDEESLPGGNSGDQGTVSGAAGADLDLDPNSGNVTQESVSVGASLGINWGADSNKRGETALDDFGRSVRFVDSTGTALTSANVTAASLGLPDGLQSDKVDLVYTITQTLSANGSWDGGYLLTATKGTGGDTIFTLDLDADSSKGSYKFTLFGPLDHDGNNVEDDIVLNFNFVATDADGDDSARGRFSITVDDDGPRLTGETAGGTADEDDLASFTLTYPLLQNFWQGSIGTSPYDTNAPDDSVTGLLGTVPVWGNLSGLVSAGADGGKGFSFADTETAIAAVKQMDLASKGKAIEDVRHIDLPVIGEALGFFSEDGRLVFGLYLESDGTYNFRLFDQLDHERPEQPITAGQAPVADENWIDIDFGAFVLFADRDDDTVSLSGKFSVRVTDDIPEATGCEYRTADEDDLANYIIVHGSLGTSPFDGFFEDYSITGLFGTVPVWGFLGDNVKGGADGRGEFGLVSEDRAEFLLETLNDGDFLQSKGVDIDRVESIDILGFGEAMGFFAGNRLVFGIYVDEFGTYNFRLFDQIDHEAPDSGADENSFFLNAGQFITFTDKDGDVIELSVNDDGQPLFVVDVVDDIPEVRGSVTFELNEGDLDNYLDPINLLLLAVGAPVVGSNGNEGDPDGGLDGLFGTTSAQGLLNQIIGTNVVHGGADELGSFGFIAESDAEDILNGDEAPLWTSKDSPINDVRVVTLPQLGSVMAFFTEDGRMVLTISLGSGPLGAYDVRIWDQIDHPEGANSELLAVEDILSLDLGQFITFTDFDGDTITLEGNVTLNVQDDIPELTNAPATIGTVEEEHFALAGDMLHGNEDNDGAGGLDNDETNAVGNLTNVTTGNMAALVKVGADEVGIFSFHASINGTAVTTVGAGGQRVEVTSRDQAVLFQVVGSKLVGYVDDGQTGYQESDRKVFTVELSEEAITPELLAQYVPPDILAGIGDLVGAELLPLLIQFLPPGLLDSVVNNNFKFTLLDQIDHDEPTTPGTAVENILNIDLSPAIRFTDADGDAVQLRDNSVQVRVVDDIPEQIKAKLDLKPVEEEHISGGNEDHDDPGAGIEDNLITGNNAVTNEVQGDLRTLVSVGADEDTQQAGYTIPAIPPIPAHDTWLLFVLIPRGFFWPGSDAVNIPGGSAGIFYVGGIEGLPMDLTSKGKSVFYDISDSDSDGLPDTITGYVSATGTLGMAPGDRPVFTFSLQNTGDDAGKFKFTLLDELDHDIGAGENIETIDFSKTIFVADNDGDVIQLASESVEIRVIDDVPTFQTNLGQTKSPDGSSVTEDDVSDYNITDTSSPNSDDAATAPAKSLNILWGLDNDTRGVGDTFGRSVFFVKSNGDPIGTSPTTAADFGISITNGNTSVPTSGGVTLTYQLVTNDFGGQVLTAYAGADKVFEVTLDALSDNGSYQFQLFRELDHKSDKDFAELTFRFRAADADGDQTEHKSFKVTVNDDGPKHGTPEGTSVYEQQLVANNGGGTAQNFGALGIAWGADDDIRGVGDTFGRSIDFTKSSGAAADKSTANAANIGLTVTGHAGGGALKSGGVALHYVITENANGGETLTAYKGMPTFVDGVVTAGIKVFELVTDPTSQNGGYTFELFQELDHASGQGDIKLNFSYRAKDADGDQDTNASLQLAVKDHGPTHGAAASSSVTEDDVSAYNGTDATPLDDSLAKTPPATLGISWGADDDTKGTGDAYGRSIDFTQWTGSPAVSTVTDNAQNVGIGIAGSAAVNALTSGGIPLYYRITENTNGGETLTAYKGQPAIVGDVVTGIKVFEVVTDPTSANGSYTFELFQELDHAQGSGSIDLYFGFTARDADGDAAANTPTFKVTIADDTLIVAPPAGNLLVNGNFNGENNGGFTLNSNAWEAGSGTANDSIPGWNISPSPTSTNGAEVLERVGEGHRGVDSPSDSLVIDLEGNPGGNVAISQTVTLPANQYHALSFEIGQANDAAHGDASALLQVLWNGVPVAGGPFNPAPGLMQTINLLVQSNGTGTNTLTFAEISTGGDSTGTYIANVSLLLAPYVVDEDALLTPGGVGAGLEGGPGDAPGLGLTTGGNLGIQWGADDGDARDVRFDPALEGATSYTSRGHVISYDIDDATGRTLTATAADGRTIFVVTLNPTLAGGSFSFELKGNIDHPAYTVEDNLPFTFGFIAKDADNDAAPGSFTVLVNDDSPVAVKDDAVVFDEDSGVHGGNVMLNTTGTDLPGADGATLTKVKVDGGQWQVLDEDGATDIAVPGKGTYHFEADGDWTFTPIENFNGTTSFSYIITDGDGDESDPDVSINNTVNITVNPVNDAPTLTASTTTFSYVESAHPNLLNGLEAHTFAGVTFTAADVDGSSYKSITLTSANAADQIYLRGNQQTAFNVQLNNGNANYSTAQQATNTLVITPKTVNGSFSAAEVQDILRKVLFHTGESVTADEDRTVNIVLTDSAGLAGNPLAMHIDVTGTNDAPNWIDEGAHSYTALEDSGFALSAMGVSEITGNDRDGNGPVTVRVTVLHGILDVPSGLTMVGGQDLSSSVTIQASSMAALNAILADPNGIRYIPDANYSGTDTMKLVLNDLGDDGLPAKNSIDKVVNLTITADADAPTLVVTDGSGDEDSAIAFSVSAALTDTDGSETLALFVSGIPVGAVLSDGINSSSAASVDVSTWNLTALTIKPPADSNVEFDLTVTARSTEATNGDTAETVETVHIDVVPVNDAPTLTASTTTFSYVESAHPNLLNGLEAHTFAGVTFTAADVDGSSYKSITLTSANAADQIYLRGNQQTAFNVQLNNGNANYSTAQQATNTLVITPKTVNGSFSAAEVQDILRKVLFHTGESVTADEDRTVNIVLTDSAGLAGNPLAMHIDVTGTNDRPFFSDTALTIGASEDVPLTLGTAYAANQVVAQDRDVDGPVQVKLTVEHGTLAVNLLAGVTIVAGSQGPRTVTLEGSLADINAMLHATDASGNIVYTSDSNYNGPDKLTLVINDLGDQLLAPESTSTVININVGAVNDAPVLSDLGNVLAYVENQAATAIDPEITLTDLDGASIEGATVGITDNYVAGQDSLIFVNQNGISGSWNSVTGILTLSGSASKADYEAALESVKYVNSSEHPSTATRTISYRVTDGDLTSNVGTATITVQSVNDGPTLSNVANGMVVAEDGTLYIRQSQIWVANDLDRSDGAKAPVVTLTLTVLEGEGVLSASRSGLSGSFDIQVTNGGKTLTITTQTGTTFDAYHILNTLLAGDNFNINTNPNGVAFKPAADWNGAVRIGYELDDHGWSGTGGAMQADGEFTLTVTPVNDAPAAVDDAAVTTEFVPVAINVLANDTDVDSPTLNVTEINGQPVSINNPVTIAGVGKVSLLADGSLAYDPKGELDLDEGEQGTASFTYTVSDGTLTSTASVNVTVTGSNFPPAVPGGQVWVYDETDALIAIYTTSPITPPPGVVNVVNANPLYYAVEGSHAGEDHSVVAGAGDYSANDGARFTAIDIKFDGMKIYGAQANEDPRLSEGSTRNANDATTESIVSGGLNAGNPGGQIFRIGANNVEINGFTVKGPTVQDLIMTRDDTGATGRSGAVVSYNIVSGSGDDGITLESHTGGTVDHNMIYAVNDGVTVSGRDSASTYATRVSDLNTVSNNEIVGGSGGSPHGGIYAYDSFNTSITGNNIHGYGGNGITVGLRDAANNGSVNGGTVSGNTVDESGRNGIVVLQSGVTVSGNEVSRSSGYAVSVGVNYNGVTSSTKPSGVTVDGNTFADNHQTTPGGVGGGNTPTDGPVQVSPGSGVTFNGNTLNGTNAANTLHGTVGADNINGGVGDDVIHWAVGRGSDTVTGGANIGTGDTFVLTGNGDKQVLTITAADADNNPANGVQDPISIAIDQDGNGTVDATVQLSGIEEIQFNLGGGADEVIINSQSFAGTSLDVSTITMDLGDGNDSVDLRQLGLSNHRVVADGGAHSAGDTVILGRGAVGYASTDVVAFEEILSASTLVGVRLTFSTPAGQVKHEFRNFESLEFKDGTVTLEEVANTKPGGTDNTVTLLEDGSHTFTASEFGFADVDVGDTLQAVRIDSLPSGGTFTLGGVAVTQGQVILPAAIGTLVYTPTANANGTAHASFTFSVQDNVGAFDPSPNTMTIDVTPVNDAPVLSIPAGITYIDTPADDDFPTVPGSVTATDVDSGDSKTYSIWGSELNHTLPEYNLALAGLFGTLYMNSTSGAYAYVPNDAAINGLSTDAIDTFTLRVKDGSNAFSNHETLTITIEAADDTGTVTGSFGDAIRELGGHGNAQSDPVDGAARGTLTFTDVDGGGVLPWTYQSSNTLSGKGWFSIQTNGYWEYGLHNDRQDVQALKEDEEVTDSFLVVAPDGTTRQITVTILGNNDAPVVSVVIPDQMATAGQSFTYVVPAGTFTDIDGAFDGSGASLVLSATLGDNTALPAWLTFDALTGTFSGTIPANYSGSLELKVSAYDGELSITDTFNVAVTVPPANASLPTVNNVDPGKFYAFTTDTRAPDDININVETLFTSSNPLKYDFVTVRGNSGWLDIPPNGSSNGSIFVKDVNGIGPDAKRQPTVLQITATDQVTGLATMTFVAFTSLSGGTFGTATFVSNNDSNLYYGQSGNFSPAADGNVFVMPDGGGTLTVNNKGAAIYGSDDADFINAYGKDGGAPYVWAGDGDDTVDGSQSADVLLGGRGSDHIYGDDQGDIIDGGDGIDFLYGESGSDFLYGGGGDDFLYGHTQSNNGAAGDKDHLDGGEGNDTLFGGQGDDVLIGGGGDDVLNGGQHTDILYGGSGLNTLTGGQQPDTFVIDASALNETNMVDLITDFGTHADTLDLSEVLDAALGNAAINQAQADAVVSLAVSSGNTIVSINGNAVVQLTGYTGLVNILYEDNVATTTQIT